MGWNGLITDNVQANPLILLLNYKSSALHRQKRLSFTLNKVWHYSVQFEGSNYFSLTMSYALT